MSRINIAINGFGRIGRCIARAVQKRDDFRLAAINDHGDLAMMAHLLKYDSTHGVMDAEVSVVGEKLRVDGEDIAVFRHGSPAALPWRELKIDVVMECTGVFADADKAAAHLDAGAGKVLVSAPAKNAALTVVYGVNDDKLTPAMRVVSNASCTTNCLAPVAKVLDETFGVEAGLLNTVHAYTSDQRLLDKQHGDYRRARAAMASMIPTQTGAAAAIGEVLPALAGKMSGLAVRVPTMNVSLIDLTCVLARDVTAAEINDALRAAADGELSGVLAVNELPLVSVDFNGREESAIVDAPQTRVAGARLAKVMAWYDNEWAFACRMLDTARAMAQAV